MLRCPPAASSPPSVASGNRAPASQRGLRRLVRGGANPGDRVTDEEAGALQGHGRGPWRSRWSPQGCAEEGGPEGRGQLARPAVGPGGQAGREEDPRLPHEVHEGAHHDHRWRDGHHDPAVQVHRGGLPHGDVQGLPADAGAQGQQRSSRLHAAGHDPRDPPSVLRGRRGHLRDQHVLGHRHRAGGLRDGARRVRHEQEGMRARRGRGQRDHRQGAPPPAAGGGRDRPDEPHALHLALRRGPWLPQLHLGRGGRRV